MSQPLRPSAAGAISPLDASDDAAARKPGAASCGARQLDDEPEDAKNGELVPQRSASSLLNCMPSGVRLGRRASGEI